ncbi:MAG: hypothetical protein JWO31_677 [Phycisphaerales bacterium]|nr:hypothetical protein [Phycisphaerales bacterium]
MWRAAAAAGVAGHVTFTGGARDVRDVLAEANAYVSVAAHEGLSLAMLEALAAGLPVVATDVGGTAEVANGIPRVTLVPADASAEEVAAAVLAAVGLSAAGATAVGVPESGVQTADPAEDGQPTAGEEAGPAPHRCHPERSEGPLVHRAAGLRVSGVSDCERLALVPSTAGRATYSHPTGGEPLASSRGGREVLRYAQDDTHSAGTGARPASSVVPSSAPPPPAPPSPTPSVAAPADLIRQNFSRERMAARYAWLYRAALGPPRGDTVWFVANNVTTGGAQSSLRRLAKALRADGVPVRVAVLQEYPDHPTPGRLDLLAAGVPVTVLPQAGLVDPAEAVEALLGELAAAPPRSVTFWNAIQSYKLLLADALLRVPVFDVSPGEMYFASLDAYFARPRPGLPYHTPRDYGERLAGVVVKYAAEAPTAAAALGCPVHVIPNGVPIPPPRPPRTPAADELVIGTATRLHPHKRVEDLIDAFRLALPRLPARAVLRVAGGPDAGCDDYARTLRDRSADLPVEWLGEVTDMAAFHAGLDLFAMISEPAGCPNASMEAMAAGLPVVATDVGGASEQVVDGVTGRLVRPRDAGELAGAMEECGAPGGRRTARGEAARQLAGAANDVRRMAAAYRALL